MDEAPLTPEEEEQQNYDVSPDERIWGVISYLFYLCIIPLLAKRESKFIQFHSKQGLILAFFLTVTTPGYIFSFLRFFFGIIHSMLIVLIIMACVQAYVGRWWKIPYIYELSKKINL